MDKWIYASTLIIAFIFIIIFHDAGSVSISVILFLLFFAPVIWAVSKLR